MPCRKERLHIVTYGIIDVGLRAGAGIDRIGLEYDAEIPSLPRRYALRVHCSVLEVSCESSGLKIEALRRFGGDGFYGIELKLPLFAPIHEKPAQSS